MNFYRKINKTILERFPTLWNTHFVWMLLICLATHLLYFGLGYASLNIEVLKNYGIKSLFFNGGYFSFYIIIGLLALIYFSLRYFAHNPFKHFYPTSQSYLWKIFAQLSFIFLLYATVFISFENGIKLKAKSITPIEDVNNDANKVILAKPFLYNQISDYLIAERSYPEPFPCEEISDFIVGYDTVNSFQKKHGVVTSKPYVTLNGMEYQFGKISDKKIDSCNSEKVLDTIYDVSKVYGLAQYSFYNYSGTAVNRKYIKYQDVEPEEDDRLIEKIHNWQKTKDSVAIAKTIEDLKKICKKYNINELLDAKKIASAGLLQDLNKQQLVRTGFVDYKKEDIENLAYVKAAGIDAVDDYGDKTDINQSKAEINYNYFVDIPKFTTLQENVESIYEEMGTKQLYSGVLWILICVSFCLALFFIMVKYIPLKDLIIGIFVAGVLATLLSFVFVLNRREDENSLLGTTIFYAIVIISIGLYGIYGRAVKKHLTTKWFVALGISLIAVFPLLLNYIRENTSKEVPQLCSESTNTVYAYDIDAWQFFVLGLVSVFIIFRLLRKLHAKEE